MSEPALEAASVDKRYRDGERTIAAVSGVTLAIERGTLTVLRGPSGSGRPPCSACSAP
ncbi:MAG: hypothetical protein M5U28_27705 [Sandaracinaceae bacterium]|nr:hypothetical protein [Sandaracinaceae bacterium]